ncbi:oligosaccharide flippase family protein [Myroides odoratimimus]|uniref:oligosaccharide flippase family protein n=1 Tax=Myroides odoratimimus TaxID=76832 RepID=UPI002578B748|nr:oligosaccharide flippase family protein [Myroides odoratimimus]MDM1412158.1 oligosaccharide flippase family protein [Myroides odoratimimus]
MSNKEGNTIQVFWVFIGNAMALGFTIISSMFLSRYLDKQDYGTYKQVMYVYSSLLAIFTLGLPKAYSYFLPRVSNGEAKDLINKINIVLLFMGGMMTLVIYFGAGAIASVLKNPLLEEPLRYFSFVPLFMIPTMGIEGILATYKQTKFLAVYNTVTKAFMLMCVVMPVVVFNKGINAAILGFTLSSFFCFVLALFFKYRPIRSYDKEESPYTYRDIFNFALPLMGASLWGIIINSSDQFFISRYFGNEVFADFANGSLELPFVGMIIVATSTVLLPIFSKYAFDQGEENKVKIIDLWKSVMSKTVKLIYPLVVFCFCFSDIIMILLYGEKYSNSGSYFQIKIIVNFFTIIAYAPLMFAIGGQKFYFKVHMYGALIVVLLEYCVVLCFNSSYLVTIVSVLCQIGRIVIMSLYLSKYFNIRIKELFPLKLIINIVVPSLIFLYVIRYGLEYFDLSIIILIVLSFVMYLVFFGLWVYYRKIDYLSIVMPLINRIKK